MASEMAVIAPTPRKLSFAGTWIPFDGIRDADPFIRREFSIPEGGFALKKVAGRGTGLETRPGEIRMWAADGP
jgi:hypothetical protein